MKVDPATLTHREYLGDGVYVGYDGYQLWFYTQEGHQIAMDPAVQQNLARYVFRFKQGSVVQ
jgi:hypothetical protein